MKNIKLDHFTEFQFISALRANREGDRAVFARSQANLKENKYESNLYLLEDGQTRQLTGDGEGRSFIWEDQDTILFAAKRNKEEKEAQGMTQYYRLRLGGGEALPAFRLPVSVSGLWPLAEERYLVLAQIDQSEPDLYAAGEKKRSAYFKEQKDFEFRHKITRIPFYFNGAGFLAQGSQRLFLYDARKEKLLPLTAPDVNIDSVFYQEGKDLIYFTAQPYSTRADYYSRIYSLSQEALSTAKMSEGKLGELVQEVYSELDYSINLIFQGREESYVFASDLKTYGINESSKIYRLTEAGLELHSEREQKLWNSMGSDAVLYGCPGIQVIEGDLYWLGLDGIESVLYCLSKDGEQLTVYQTEARLDGFALIEDEFYFVALQADKLQEIYRLANGQLKAVTHFNEKVLKKYYIAEPQPLEVGEIQGWVLLPEGFDRKKKYPAILDIHGGPRTIYGSCFFHEMQYWVGQGYVVFFCNPRGSDGRGDAFADIRGKYGTIDYEDIMAFTDAVLARYPQIDPERVGVTGGSYGGFMTNWIIGHTDRFRAAATQRSISNWLSFVGTSDISYNFACDQNACDTLSEEGFMKLWEHSPIRYINNVKTPTLIIHSDADYRCPEEQAFQLFTALLDRGVPSEFYLFKDETHELSRSGRPKGRIERLRRITEWMDKYLKEEAKASKEPKAKKEPKAAKERK